jgi:hypothetical protein
MRLGAGDFVVGKPQRTGADEFTWTYSLSWAREASTTLAGVVPCFQARARRA